MKKSVIVVDLDGTLSKSNTFHAFIRYILKKSFKSLDWLWFFKILFWSGFRAFKLISHKRWKFQILKDCTGKKIDVEAFLYHIHKTINKFILDEIKNYQVSILATAAPELYAISLAKKYHFTHYSATVFNQKYTFFTENKQLTKFNNVKQLLANIQNETIDLLITDHIDDKELISDAQKSWLINPDELLKRYVNNHNLIKNVKYIYLK